MNPNPKPKREVDKKYLEFIKKQFCLCRNRDCIGDTSPHHTTTKAASGSDLKTVPLCATHHSEVHNIGRDTFQKKYNIRFDEEIIKLLARYARGRNNNVA